ncbi:MAG: phenylalanine--tRNA ligase subunit beta [Candidatus Saccharimonas aalborgensis]
MKVSLNLIKQFTSINIPVDELVATINNQLGGVEEVTELGVRYKNITIVKVVSCEKHPNADKLSVCKIDDGQSVRDVDRDVDGYVQVVCGAPNVHANMWAVWLPPHTTVPASYADAKPFVLEPREIRGVMSNGMLGAGDELAINSDHNGIIELREEDMPPHIGARGLATGQDFAEAMGLDDTIIDIENKMFTHRPDCFGQLGVAREIAGITGQPFHSPEWYTTLPSFLSANSFELTVTNQALTQVPRFMAVGFSGIEVKPSPLWLQCELIRLGSKAINNIVDVTNYVMLLTAQPTHAYDYDKLRGHALGARMASSGEKVTLLNGKTYELGSDDIVIADQEGPVGLAGIMGGSNSEVSDTTTSIVLEVATFDMYAVRKSSMRHGVFTDALTRFNKGQSPQQNPYVLNLLMMSIIDVAGGAQATEVVDVGQTITPSKAVVITPSFINNRLGLSLAKPQITTLLSNVEMRCDDEVSDDGDDAIVVLPPYWRMDIEVPEDVVEEVGRLYGFDALPRELPKRAGGVAMRNKNRVLKQRIRQSLARAGANEVLTYSFVHEQVMKKAEQDASRAFRLGNAISPDLHLYRLSVLPSLLDKVHANIKNSYDEFVLFEIGKGHDKVSHLADDNGLPGEPEFVDAVYASKKPRQGAAYYMMRRLVSQLAKDLGLTLKLIPIDNADGIHAATVFAPARSARIESRQGEYIGIVGELKQSVRKAFKLPDYTAAMTLELAGIANAVELKRNNYQPLSRYPSTSQDISLKTAFSVPYEKIFHCVWSAATEKMAGIDIRLEPVAVYSAEDNTDKKTTTLHITFTSYDKTLTDQTINPVMDHIASCAKDELAAERV